MFVDLHIHSYFSDGAQTPEQAARTARDNGVGLAALCDHNNWLGCERFADACRELGVIPVRGAEFDCSWRDKHLHLLAYRFNPTPELAEIAHRCRELLLQMSVDLIGKMAPEYPALSPEEYRSYHYDALKGGWAGLHYLWQKGVTPTLSEGMHYYRDYDLDYTTYPFPSAQEVCEAIRNADGIVVLAHPTAYFAALDLRELYEVYDALAKLGVEGIETFYPGQDATLTLRTRLYCERNHLLMTSGSDSHGLFAHVNGWEQYQIGALMTEPRQLCLGELVPAALLE